MLLDHFVTSHYWPYCQRLRLSTVVGYESAYRVHIESRFGSVDMDEITVEDVETWLAEFPSSGAAKKAWSVLRGMLRKAYKWSHTDNDITHREITQPKHRRREPVVLNVQGVRDLLRGFYGHELEPLVTVAVCLGLRRGEACALTWGDIDLRSGGCGRARVPAIRRQASRRRGLQDG